MVCVVVDMVFVARGWNRTSFAFRREGMSLAGARCLFSAQRICHTARATSISIAERARAHYYAARLLVRAARSNAREYGILCSAATCSRRDGPDDTS